MALFGPDLNQPTDQGILLNGPNPQSKQQGRKMYDPGKGKAIKPYKREAIKTRLERRWGTLDIDWQTWRPMFLEICDLFLPRRSRWLVDAGVPNKGYKRHYHIVDATPLVSLRTLAAGMMAGATSPSRPWFRMKTSLDHLMDIPAVKQWLYLAEQRMQDVFARSNFYNQLAVAYLEHGAYGTGTLAIFEDPKTVINCVAYTIGSYRIANNAKMRVDTFYRWYKWTVRQIVLEFVGDPAELNEEEFNAWLADDAVWANVSGSIRTQFAVGQYENWIDLKQCIEQRAVRDPSRRDNKNQPVASYYYELGGNPDQLLEESGYHEFPIMVFRWAVNAEDVYGNGPCGDCLGDAKALMLQQKRKAQAIDKMVDPPTVASPKLRQQRVNMLPGSVVYFDETAGKSGVRPIYEVKPDAQLLLEDIKETQDRIRKVCFEDVFQLLSNMEATPQKTAVEIQALMQEKMLMMGPVLELLNDELLNPAVDRVFNILMRKTLQGEEDGFPPVPQELSNIDLRIEFISILAQAQKAVATGAIQQLVGFALQLAQAHQEVLDAINFDEIIDSYADAVGTAPKLLNPQDQRDQVRQQRQQQQQQQQKIAMAEQASKAVGNVAGGAQSLANSPAGGGNALENILGINPSGGGP